MTKVEYDGERTVHTFDFLREAAARLLAQAEEIKVGAFYPSMMSMVATAFFLEASLNHVGLRLFDDWQTTERSLNPGEKLAKIASKLGLELDWSRRPHQTFAKLFKRRDALAHGKTETVRARFRANSDLVPPNERLRTRWERACKPSEARRCFDDAVAIAQRLFERAGLKSDFYFASTSSLESVDSRTSRSG
jgi:hypothetical protein